MISTELNRAVVELLQQLLFWQERAKATSPYNVAKRKRLVSGLRCAMFPYLIPSQLLSSPSWCCSALHIFTILDAQCSRLLLALDTDHPGHGHQLLGVDVWDPREQPEGSSGSL